jgi:hypothetical protein
LVSVIPRHPFPTEHAEGGIAVLQKTADGWIEGLEADSTGLGEALDPERDRITALCRVPLSLLRENGARYKEFDYAWIDALQTYWLGDDLGSKLVAAVGGADSDTSADQETVSKYWSHEDRAGLVTGLVALAPLAMACFAHDAGIPIEVESEYLPAAFLGRNWCGEFPT